MRRPGDTAGVPLNFGVPLEYTHSGAHCHHIPITAVVAIWSGDMFLYKAD